MRISSKVRSRRANKGSKQPYWHSYGAPYYPDPERHTRFKKKKRFVYGLEVNLLSITKLVDTLRKELDTSQDEVDFGPLRDFESDPYSPKSGLGTSIGPLALNDSEIVIRLEKRTKKARDNAKAVIEAMFLAHGLIPAFFQITTFEKEIEDLEDFPAF